MICFERSYRAQEWSGRQSDDRSQYPEADFYFAAKVRPELSRQ